MKTFVLTVAFITAACLINTHAGHAMTPPGDPDAPTLGGGRISAAMVMPSVAFDGNGLSIRALIDREGNAITEVPVLRPLLATDDPFDPGKPWTLPLSGKAYNRQYGWNRDSESAQIPINTFIYIEQLSATPGLQAYDHLTYAPIFGTDGSSPIWQWNSSMAHNAYAVDPQISSWQATYRLFVGEADGTELTEYKDTQITLNWTSIPEPSAVALLALIPTSLLRRRRT